MLKFYVTKQKLSCPSDLTRQQERVIRGKEVPSAFIFTRTMTLKQPIYFFSHCFPQSFSVYKTKLLPGVVAHSCNPSYLGGRGVTRGYSGSQPGKKNQQEPHINQEKAGHGIVYLSSHLHREA
jgi:hypothetical protein